MDGFLFISVYRFLKAKSIIIQLFDHCTNTYVKAMNLVVIHARKANGLQYPLFYSIWNKEQENEIHLTKLDLALQMLQTLKKQLPLPVRLCVAMDSWYFVKSLYLEIEKLEFDWVTKARKNTLLYQKVTIRGKERFIEILPEVLFKEAKPIFTFWRKKKSVCMAFKDIYIKKDSIQVYFDTTAKPFATFFREFWPPQLRMAWFGMDYNQNWNIIPQSG